MKLSPTATTLILSGALLLALITSIISLSPGSLSSVALRILTTPLRGNHQHHNSQHHNLQHKPRPIRPDSNLFGLSDADTFLSYSISPASNHLQLLRCAIHLSKMTGRKILVSPASVKLEDNQFSIWWLQILNFNSINSQLNPTHRPCLIRGLNYGEPDPSILEYVYNGTLLSPRGECNETSQDAPWQLRDPNSWSTECYLLPWALTPHIAATVNKSIPYLVNGIKPDPAAFRFPGNGLCGKPFLEHDYHFMESGPNPAITSMDDKLVLLAGDSMSDCDSLPGLELSPNVHIESIASAVVSARYKPILCMHVRSTNVSLLIQASNEIISSNNISHTFIMTDGVDDAKLNLLQSGILGSVEFGCDHSRFPICRKSDNIRDAIEQQICTTADFFVGTRRTLFTNQVMDLRQQRQTSSSSSILFN